MEEQNLENALAMIEARMDEIVTRLKKSEEESSNFKEFLERYLSQKMTEEQTSESSQKLLSQIGNWMSSTEQQPDPEDPDLSNIYDYLKLSKFDVASVMSFASGIDQF